MSTPKVMTVKLSRPVSGEEIKRAAQVVAGKDFHEFVRVIDDIQQVAVGQMSKYPSMNVAVVVGDNYEEMSLQDDSQYTHVGATYYMWPDLYSVYAVDESEDAPIIATRNFRDRLQEELLRLSS